MKKFWVVNQIEPSTAEILIYGYIGCDDVTASDFVRELKELEKTNATINIRINSGGGSIFEGLAIFNAIRNSRANIVAYIDGIAASMGSVIAMAPKKVYMSNSAMFMTHRASGMAFGNANDLRNYAQMMEGLEKSICSIYAAKTGLTEDQARQKYLTNEDKWLTAEEALAEKIIDGIYDAPVVAAPPATRNEQELVSYYNAAMKFQTSTENTMKVINVTAAQLAAMKLPADADAAAFENAFNKLIEDAAKVPQLTNDLSVANAAKKKAEDDLSTLKKKVNDDAVAALINGAQNEKKITVELGNKLKADYATNPEGLKALIDALPAHVSIVEKINNKKEENTKLAEMTWDELDKAGKLEDLKKVDFELFKSKYKEAFSKEYKN